MSQYCLLIMVGYNLKNPKINFVVYQHHSYHSENCQTKKGDNCVFPFTYKEKTYHRCTAKDSENGKAWCPTSVEENGEVTHGKWGDCEDSCFQSGKNNSEEIKGNADLDATLCVIFMILVSLENVKKMCFVWLPLHSKKFQRQLILAFEANRALSCKNETKIVKIKHSVLPIVVMC